MNRVRSAAVCAFAAVALVACSGSKHAPAVVTPDATATVANTATPAPVPATSRAAATAPSTGHLALDEIIRLALLRNEAALHALLHGAMEPCTRHQSPGSGAACHADEPEGTLVDTIGVGVCDGNGARVEDIRLVPEASFDLYSVSRSSYNGGEAYRITFRYNETPQTVGGFSWIIVDGHIVGVYEVCGGLSPTPSDGVDYLIRPAAAASIRPCTSADLEMVGESSEGAAGTAYVTFRVGNTSATACRVAGGPDVHLFRQDGVEIAQGHPTPHLAFLLPPAGDATPVPPAGAGGALVLSYFTLYGNECDPASVRAAMMTLVLPENGGAVSIALPNGAAYAVAPCHAFGVFWDDVP